MDKLPEIPTYTNTLTKLTSVIYCGTEMQWNKISVGNENTKLTRVQRQYHDWHDATCITPKFCSICDATEGDVLSHNYADGICTICGKPEKHDHIWEDGHCALCEMTITDVADLSCDGKITVFDAQILAETNAGLRTLPDEVMATLGDQKPADIVDYILGRYDIAD